MTRIADVDIGYEINGWLTCFCFFCDRAVDFFGLRLRLRHELIVMPTSSRRFNRNGQERGNRDFSVLLEAAKDLKGRGLKLALTIVRMTPANSQTKMTRCV